MSEIDGTVKSAKHIYEKGYGPTSLYKIDAEDFYIELREAIESEYKRQGYCELIDEILSNQWQWLQIDAIVYYAIEAVGKKRLYKKGECQCIPNEYIQLRSNNVPWKQVYCCQFCFDIKSALSEINECRKRGQRSHMKRMSNQTNEMIIKAKRESDSIINAAQGEASKIIESAKTESDSIISAAQSEASKIIESAKKEASQLRQTGENELSGIGTPVFLEKNINENQHEVSVGESATEYLYSQQRKFRQECEREISTLIEQNQKSLAKSEAIHDQMCSKTNELQVTWMKSLTSATDQLIALKEEFYKHLRTWQQGLYPSEYEQLAERYIELYRIIDLDNVISETMVDAEKNTVVLKKLQSLDKSLRIFLHKFEISMNGLCLYVYRAEGGDDFDYVWHMNEDDSIDCAGKKIRKCITPGVARRVQGDDEDDVIIPALVSIYER